VTVRRATLDDALAIATIHVRAWQVAYQGIVDAAFLDSLSVEEREARWRKNLTEGASAMYVAEGPDGVIGWASVGRCRDPDATPATGELWAMYVAPDRWHRGIGRALWARGRSHLAGDGFKEVVVWVLEDNRPARRFYEAVGFGGEPDQIKVIDIGGAGLREIRLRGPLGGD
jgi:ribosomal protein S18 acetylase RimI-like enzyme